MIGRSLLAWLLIAVLANVNGAVRQFLLLPRVSEGTAHVVSTAMLGVIVLATAWLLLPWMGPRTARDAWLIGILWLAGTLAFEFLVGHYVFGSPWAKLLADYDLTRGRVWVVIPLLTLVAPAIAFGFGRR